MTDSQRVELCQCPGCGREIEIPADMARLGDRWVLVLGWDHAYPPPLCPVCGLKPGEPDG